VAFAALSTPLTPLSTPDTFGPAISLSSVFRTLRSIKAVAVATRPPTAPNVIHFFFPAPSFSSVSCCSKCGAITAPFPSSTWVAFVDVSIPVELVFLPRSTFEEVLASSKVLGPTSPNSTPGIFPLREFRPGRSWPSEDRMFDFSLSSILFNSETVEKDE
jgi:hypothetical protein